MRRTRAQAWWDAFRYGAGWQIALYATALVAGIAYALVNLGQFSTAMERADRQTRMEAECIARGGHIVLMLLPERGQRDRTCYGG